MKPVEKTKKEEKKEKKKEEKAVKVFLVFIMKKYSFYITCSINKSYFLNQLPPYWVGTHGHTFNFTFILKSFHDRARLCVPAYIFIIIQMSEYLFEYKHNTSVIFLLNRYSLFLFYTLSVVK